MSPTSLPIALVGRKTMIISLTLENWRCFKSRTVFSMVATKERTGSEHLVQLPAMYRSARVLPISAIYGPNASGKTSLIAALGLIQRLVLDGTPENQKIPIDPFLLDPACAQQPSRFAVELLIGNLIYVYSLALTPSAVREESLTVKRTRNEELVFRREEGEYTFGQKHRDKRYDLIASNTRDNQLFLHYAIMNNAESFRPVYDWFANSLQILNAGAGQCQPVPLREDFLGSVNRRLPRYGTGVDEVALEEIPLRAIPVCQQTLDGIAASRSQEKAPDTLLRVDGQSGYAPTLYVIHSALGSLQAREVKLLRHDLNGNAISSEFRNESSGNQRLIELLLLSSGLSSSPEGTPGCGCVYVMDEPGRSLSSEVTAKLIADYVEECDPDTRSQLVFSTHDLILMDEDSLRRDELWVCERDEKGESRLVRIGESDKARKGTDLVRNYRKGAFGATPEASSGRTMR